MSATTFALVGILLTIFTIPFAYAEIQGPGIEKGPDYDSKLVAVNPDGTATFKWTSHPQRLEIAPNIWENSKITDSQDYLKYESASTSARISKSDCDLKIYDSGFIGSNPSKILVTHTAKTAKNGTDNWTALSVNDLTCDVTYTENDGDVTVTARKSGLDLLGMGIQFDVIYEISHAGKIKESYELLNKDLTKLDDKFGFTTVFHGSLKIDIDGNTYDTANINEPVSISPNSLESRYIRIYDDFGYEVFFDPQNYIHNYLWIIKVEQGKIIFDFTYSKGKLPFGETLRVDPTYAYTDANRRNIVSSLSAAVSCSVSPYTKEGDANSNQIQMSASANPGGKCTLQMFQWNTTSIPSSPVEILDMSFRYDITAISNAANCDINQIESGHSINTTDATTLWNDAINAANGTTYVDNNSGCTTVANDKVVDLGASADAYFESTHTAGLFAIAAVFDTFERGAVARSVDFGGQNELQIIYTITTPEPVTNFDAVSQARNVQFSWTASTNGSESNGVTGHYIGRSLDNSTWPAANKTSIGNVTSYLDTSYWRINTLYYVNITASNGVNSTAAYDSLTTDNVPSAPANPYTTPLSDSILKINWSPPSSDGNDAITAYRIESCIVCTSWTVDSNNTATLNYNKTGLSSGQTVTFRMAAWNGVGLGTYTANFTGQTFIPTTGSLTIETGVVGDVVQVNSTVAISGASPTPVTVSLLRMFVNGTLYETKAVSVSIASGASSSNFDPFWYQMTAGSVYQVQVRATVSNATGNVVFNATSNEQREYLPTYEEAIDPAEGLVNATVSRSADQDTVYIKINRDKGGATFNIECLLQTQTEASFDPTAGIWRNSSVVGYYNTSISGFEDSSLYGTCYNSGELLTFQSYSNGSLILFGIQVFDDTYGAFLGVPVGVFFIVMLAGAASQRTAPTWIVILLAVAGVMATIGFFSLSTNIWALALVAGLLGLIVGRKFY